MKQHPSCVPMNQPHSIPKTLFFLLWTRVSTDSLTTVYPTHCWARPPHPFSYPPCAHIICFELAGDTSLWRGRKKLFKLHKHNVARAATGTRWWMGTTQRKRVCLPRGDDRSKSNCLLLPATSTGEAAFATCNHRRDRFYRCWVHLLIHVIENSNVSHW